MPKYNVKRTKSFSGIVTEKILDGEVADKEIAIGLCLKACDYICNELGGKAIKIADGAAVIVAPTLRIKYSVHKI